MDTAVDVFYKGLLEKEPLTQMTVSTIIRKVAAVCLLAPQHCCTDREITYSGYQTLGRAAIHQGKPLMDWLGDCQSLDSVIRASGVRNLPVNAAQRIPLYSPRP
jgi:hypothetical protein